MHKEVFRIKYYRCVLGCLRWHARLAWVTCWCMWTPAPSRWSRRTSGHVLHKAHTFPATWWGLYNKNVHPHHYLGYNLSFVCCVSQISSLLFVNGSELQSPGSLSPQKVSQLVPLLPLLGVEFLQQLNQSQLVPVFSVLTSVHFTPTQVRRELYHLYTTSYSV